MHGTIHIKYNQVNWYEDKKKKKNVLFITACSVNNNKNVPENGTLMEAKSKSQLALKHLYVDKKRIMPHATCSEQAVDALLARSDWIAAKKQTRKC